MAQTDVTAPGPELTASTPWMRRVRTPMRQFLATEVGSAAVLLAATILALLWANLSPGGYERIWRTGLSVRLGDHGLGMDLREWVNSGLMAFFFFVVGLEARREFDLGELRERRRLVLPLLACVGGMAVPVVIYLAFTAGQPTARGWGAVMSTDTAFALGLLATLGRRVPDRVRTFMLTVTVVDDLVALAVIAVFYSSDIDPLALAIAVVILCVGLAMRRTGVRAVGYLPVAVAAWVALLRSGIDPVVVGLLMGLLTYAHQASREDLLRASELFREFREQPTAELARSARVGVSSAISPNDRLQQLYHPWTSYLIVPLFALANMGLSIDGGFLAHAYTQPLTLAVILGYVAGKPTGIGLTAWLTTVLSRGRLRPPVGWAAVGGVGTIAGIGFTVALLISTLAFTGQELEEAKLGVLTAAACSWLLTFTIFRVTSKLPLRSRIRALLGSSEAIIDLAAPVDPERDHIRGPVDALITIVEYGDFECPYCGQAEPVVRSLLAGHAEIRYVWRHLPLTDVHPQAQLAAEAAELAADQGSFWEMHDLLLSHQDALRPRDLSGYAEQLGLDVARFRTGLVRHTAAGRVAEDVDTADLSQVSGTPTFFIDGRRHHGAYDIDALTEAVKAAKARAIALA